jgi:hypothetical protein
VYCSKALYSHSIPIEVRNTVELIITYRSFSSCNLSTYLRAKNKAKYDTQSIIRLIINNSCAVLVSSSLLSRTFAQALTPYVGIPNCANKLKYDIKEVANDTFPVPTGVSILDTYGKVISGNMIDETASIAFITIFLFREGDCILFLSNL